MNYETNRLETFSSWPSSAPVSPARIAKAGFFYTGEGLEVQCFSCNSKISQWNYGDQVMWRHRRLSPTCAFVVDQNQSGNVPIIPECSSPEDSWTSLDEGPVDTLNYVDSTTQDYGLTEEDEMYRSAALRFLSFVNSWDVSIHDYYIIIMLTTSVVRLANIRDAGHGFHCCYRTFRGLQTRRAIPHLLHIRP